MAEKILAVRVVITGVTDETRQIATLNSELDKLKQRRNEINAQASESGRVSKKQKEELQGLDQATRDLNARKEQLVKTEKLAAKEFTATAGSMNELRAKTASLRNEANNLNLTTKEGQKRFKEVQGQIETNTKKIRDYDRGMSGSSTLVGEYSKGILNAFSKIGIAVAGAWAVIKSGEKIIMSAKGSAELWEKSLSAVKGGLDAVFRSIATGDFSNFFRNIGKSIELGWEYAEMLDDMEHRTFQYTIAEAKARSATLLDMRVMYDVMQERTKRIEAAEAIDKREMELAETKQKDMTDKFEEEAKIAAERAGWNRDELLFYLENYSQIKENIEIGEKYNSLKRRIANELVYSQGRYNDYIKSLMLEQEAMGANGIAWGKYVDTINKLGPEEIKSVVESYKVKIEADNQYLENTTKTARYTSKLKKQLADEDEKSAETAKKAAEDTRALYIEVELMISKAEIRQQKLFEEKQKQTVDKAMKGAGKFTFTGGRSEISTMPGENPRFTAEQIADAEILKLKKENYEKELALQKKALEMGEITEGEYLRRRTIAYQVAYQGTTQDVLASLEGLVGGLEAFGGESKALTIAKIGLDTASAISSLMAMSEANPTNAVTFGMSSVIQFATGLIRILANVAMAYKYLKGGKKGKAMGGEITGDSGWGVPSTSSGDNILILAKRGEVVLNKQQQAHLGSEAFRRAGVPGFASGGMVGYQGIKPSGSSAIDISLMASKMASVINEQKVYVSINEIRDTLNKYISIRNPSVI